MSRNLDSQLQGDQDEFERKIFKAGNFSEIPKNLKIIRRGIQLPSEMYLECRKATEDKEKADLFNTFFSLIFQDLAIKGKLKERN